METAAFTIGLTEKSATFREGLTVALERLGFLVESPVDDAARFLQEGSRWLAFAVREEAQWSDLVKEVASVEHVIALCAELEPALWARTLADGAAGVADWNSPASVIATAVESATRGEVVLPAELARRMVPNTIAGNGPLLVADDEREWLQMLSEGVSVRDLREQALMSERVLHRRLQSLYLRLGASNRDQAIKRASQLGLVD